MLCVARLCRQSLKVPKDNLCDEMMNHTTLTLIIPDETCGLTNDRQVRYNVSKHARFDFSFDNDHPVL